jgi:hypothetical protein
LLAGGAETSRGRPIITVSCFSEGGGKIAFPSCAGRSSRKARAPATYTLSTHACALSHAAAFASTHSYAPPVKLRFLRAYVARQNRHGFTLPQRSGAWLYGTRKRNTKSMANSTGKAAHLGMRAPAAFGKAPPYA